MLGLVVFSVVFLLSVVLLYPQVWLYPHKTSKRTPGLSELVLVIYSSVSVAVGAEFLKKAVSSYKDEQSVIESSNSNPLQDLEIRSVNPAREGR